MKEEKSERNMIEAKGSWEPKKRGKKLNRPTWQEVITNRSMGTTRGKSKLNGL